MSQALSIVVILAVGLHEAYCQLVSVTLDDIKVLRKRNGDIFNEKMEIPGKTEEFTLDTFQEVDDPLGHVNTRVEVKIKSNAAGVPLEWKGRKVQFFGEGTIQKDRTTNGAVFTMNKHFYVDKQLRHDFPSVNWDEFKVKNKKSIGDISGLISAAITTKLNDGILKTPVFVPQQAAL